MTELPDIDSIESTNHVIRGQRVMLDADLAALYGVSTRRLNEQVRRNEARFPPDFMFPLSAGEWSKVNMSQIATCSQRTTHEEAVLKLLAEIRRLTQFPESPCRGIGFTAEWPLGR